MRGTRFGPKMIGAENAKREPLRTYAKQKKNTSAKAVERSSEKICVKHKGFFSVPEKGGGFGGEEVQL